MNAEYAFHCSESATASWHVSLASSDAEGYYTCNVTNFAGYTLAETYLDIKGILMIHFST